MQWLIDGYNLMYASGAVGDTGTTREGFRRRRRRFLNDLADDLGPRQARETVIVFDANSPPVDFEVETTYKGMLLIFALEDEDADSRIEKLIAEHSAPKSLTVVSSDRRVRQAAARRKARSLTSDQFLDFLDRRRSRRTNGDARSKPDPERPETPSGQEADYWLEQFRHLEAMPEIQDAVAPNVPMLTDAEIERLRREIESSPD